MTRLVLVYCMSLLNNVFPGFGTSYNYSHWEHEKNSSDITIADTRRGPWWFGGGHDRTDERGHGQIKTDGDRGSFGVQGKNKSPHGDQRDDGDGRGENSNSYKGYGTNGGRGDTVDRYGGNLDTHGGRGKTTDGFKEYGDSDDGRGRHRGKRTRADSNGSSRYRDSNSGRDYSGHGSKGGDRERSESYKGYGTNDGRGDTVDRYDGNLDTHGDRVKATDDFRGYGHNGDSSSGNRGSGYGRFDHKRSSTRTDSYGRYRHDNSGSDNSGYGGKGGDRETSDGYKGWTNDGRGDTVDRYDQNLYTHGDRVKTSDRFKGYGHNDDTHGGNRDSDDGRIEYKGTITRADSNGRFGDRNSGRGNNGYGGKDGDHESFDGYKGYGPNHGRGDTVDRDGGNFHTHGDRVKTTDDFRGYGHNSDGNGNGNRGSGYGRFDHKRSSTRHDSNGRYIDNISGRGYGGYGGKSGERESYEDTNRARGDSASNHGGLRYTDNANSSGRGGSGGSRDRKENDNNGNSRERGADSWSYKGSQKRSSKPELNAYTGYKDSSRGGQHNKGPWWFSGSQKNLVRSKLSTTRYSSSENDYLTNKGNHFTTKKMFSKQSTTSFYYADREKSDNIRFDGDNDDKERHGIPDGLRDKFSEIFVDHKESLDHEIVSDSEGEGKAGGFTRDYIGSNKRGIIAKSANDKSKFGIYGDHRGSMGVSGNEDEPFNIFNNDERSSMPSGSASYRGSIGNGQNKISENLDGKNNDQKSNIEPAGSDGSHQTRSKTNHSASDPENSKASDYISGSKDGSDELDSITDESRVSSQGNNGNTPKERYSKLQDSGESDGIAGNPGGSSKFDGNLSSREKKGSGLKDSGESTGDDGRLNNHNGSTEENNGGRIKNRSKSVGKTKYRSGGPSAAVDSYDHSDEIRDTTSSHRGSARDRTKSVDNSRDYAGNIGHQGTSDEPDYSHDHSKAHDNSGDTVVRDDNRSVHEQMEKGFDYSNESVDSTVSQKNRYEQTRFTIGIPYWSDKLDYSAGDYEESMHASGKNSRRGGTNGDDTNDKESFDGPRDSGEPNSTVVDQRDSNKSGDDTNDKESSGGPRDSSQPNTTVVDQRDSDKSGDDTNDKESSGGPRDSSQPNTTVVDQRDSNKSGDDTNDKESSGSARDSSEPNTNSAVVDHRDSEKSGDDSDDKESVGGPRDSSETISTA